MIGNGNSVSKYDFVRHFFKMSYIAREGSKNYQKKRRWLCLTHIQSPFRYMNSKLSFLSFTKWLVTAWAKNYQANPLLRFFDGFRNRMISPASLALHIPIPPTIVNFLVLLPLWAMGPYISRTTPESAATFPSPHQKSRSHKRLLSTSFHCSCEKSATATGAESFGFAGSPSQEWCALWELYQDRWCARKKRRKLPPW